MKFSKMHGLGNDFIILTEEALQEEKNYAVLAKKLCNRHTGIGADGILFVLPSVCADIRMRIINCDGSEAEMCGNGVRCFARYVFENNLISKKEFSIETLAGIIYPKLTVKDHTVTAITINMGKPLWNRSDIPMKGKSGEAIAARLCTAKSEYKITSLFMGVPHTILFVEHVADVPIRSIGPAIEKHPDFLHGTNVNFVEVKNRHEIYVRTWERGAGPTLACGTGCCASVAAAWKNGLTERCVTAHLPLGSLEIEYKADDDIYMTGPGEYAFEGTLR